MSLLPVNDALRRLLDDVEPLARTEDVPLRLAAGRVLAADLLARRTQPAFDASAMDGYAVRAADVVADRKPLRVIGEAAAGRALERAVGPGEAARIFTGAPVPEGADAILIQENAEADGAGNVLPTETVTAGQHIRRAGVDFRDGALLLCRGALLNSGGGGARREQRSPAAYGARAASRRHSRDRRRTGAPGRSRRPVADRRLQQLWRGGDGRGGRRDRPRLRHRARQR